MRILGLTLLICFIMTLTFSGRTQSVKVSSFEKISSATPYLRVLGKNSMGILVYRYGKKLDLLYSYDNDLNLRWKKAITVSGKSASIVSNIITKDGLLIFYTNQETEVPVMFVRKAYDDLIYRSPATLIDSLFDYKNERIRVIRTKDKSKYCAYYISEVKENQATLHAIILNEELKILSKINTLIKFNEGFEPKLREISLFENGSLFYLIEEVASDKKEKKVQNSNRYILYQNTLDGGAQKIEISKEGKYIQNLEMEFDLLKQNLVIVGFYGATYDDRSIGTVHVVYDLRAREIIKNSFQRFPDEVLDNMHGKSRSSTEKGMYSYKAKDIVVRDDGGLVLVAESHFTTTETRSSTGYYPSMFYSTITYTYYHFNDILLISIHPDGSLHWDKQIRKNQVSEGDEGFFSSYHLAHNKNKLHFIFNDDVIESSSVSNYALKGSGSGELSSLHVSGKDLMLVPRMGKQISYNEIVMPSIFRNKLKIVKITL